MMLSKNRFIFLILICCFLQFETLVAQKLAADNLPVLKGKKILIVYGGWKGHQPKAFADKMHSWLETKGAVVTTSNTLEIYTDKAVMSETDLIIQSWTMGKISKAQEEGLLNAVKNGTGLAGCHGGIVDAFRQNVKYQYMTGGQWVSHPGGKIDYEVSIINRKDPITKGLKDFIIKNTEQYYMHIDPNSKVLATTTFDDKHHDWIKGSIMPIAWKKHFGEGRVFCLSIGHETKDFDTPSAWKLLTRGVRWASGSKYQPKEDTVNPVYKN